MSRMEGVDRRMRRVRQRGATSVLFAIVLAGFLGGVIALVVDGGHLFKVRNELQNAADSAALAGARDLNGEQAGIGLAPVDAMRYAGDNATDGNSVNLPPGDITFGNFNLATHTFTPLSTPLQQINAVKVVTRRDGTANGSVPMFFAPLIGISQEDVTATAVGVGGGPSQACGFPVAVAACSLYDGSGNLNCGANFCFGPNNAGCDAALTAFTQSNPSVPDVDCAFANALGVPAAMCPKNCTCPVPCLTTNTSTQIYINNGNSMSQSDVADVTWALQNAAPNPLYIQVPVFDNGQPSGCGAPGSSALNQLWTPVGYVTLQILGTICPNGGGGNCINVSVNCTQTSNQSAGGNLYGTPAAIVFLGQ